MDNKKELTLKYDESVLNRVKAERTSLKLDISGLRDFLNKYKASSDSYTQKQFRAMQDQIRVMVDYYDVLSYRIDMMNIARMEEENGKDN